MDFNLKQWRDESEEDDHHHQESSSSSLKQQPKLLFNSHQQQQQSSATALPLFVPELTSNLSAYSSDHSTTKIPNMGSCYFSLAQLQELQLQALIFKHIIAGAAVPQELLHLVKKNIINSHSPQSLSPYYLSSPLHQYYPHYQQPMVQSGYWGRGAMDPEPGRCRRTDGKKWRCARDVVMGQKYCERHVHRGRNRSRKPVETPTTTTPTTPYGGADREARKTIRTSTQGLGVADGGGVPGFTLSGPSPSMDLLHLNRRPSDHSIIETKDPFDTQSESQSNGGRTLRHFIDDWPRSLHETDSTTNLSISMPGNPSSDFSLKLGTGNGDNSGGQAVIEERERPHLNWGATWENNHVAPMGGPLAEVLRSSTNSSPTSVLHRLSRGSEASYVST